ncbi:BfmA/BtgA family mobilization protein [Christiangramia sp.]|uniref:BfmA/BtgA family mobilization protein n=1 Tax=Christiangramia sp. TaxID=1931228 RepID=UPI002611AF45|nr:BfmA/BtgA family mobilization protein [Christiangramia sp.]
MDLGYENEPFQGLRIKASVAEKFRQYARKLSKSQSMTLLLMLDFFEINAISPKEKIGPKIQTLESFIKKRINALVAIIRDIEQQQTVPTKAMLEALFEGLPVQTRKKVIPSFEEAFKNLERTPASLPKISSETDHKDIRNILRKVETVKPPFGKAYYKLTLDPEEVKRLKTKYHVYHD